MPRTSRRSFLQRSAAAAAASLGVHLGSSPWLRAAGANEDVRLAVVGVGSRTKIGGMGRNEIRSFRQVPGVRIVALCDVDEANLRPEVESFQKRNEKVAGLQPDYPSSSYFNQSRRFGFWIAHGLDFLTARPAYSGSE